MEWAASRPFGRAGGGCVQTDGAHRLFAAKAGDGGYQGLGVGVEGRAEDALGGADLDKFA
jgi:hypothetical protein